MRNASLLILLGMVGFAHGQADEEPWKNEIPAEVQVALDKAESATLFSMHPKSSAKPFDDPTLEDWSSPGNTAVNAADRVRLAKAFRAAVAEAKPGGFGCFKPRHKLRLVHNGATYDLLICFECGGTRIYKDGKILAGVSTVGRRTHGEVFNDVLRAAKIEIAQ